jgi:hypothetical protein
MRPQLGTENCAACLCSSRGAGLTWQQSLCSNKVFFVRWAIWKTCAFESKMLTVHVIVGQWSECEKAYNVSWELLWICVLLFLLFWSYHNFFLCVDPLDGNNQGDWLKIIGWASEGRLFYHDFCHILWTGFWSKMDYHNFCLLMIHLIILIPLVADLSISTFSFFFSL